MASNSAGSGAGGSGNGSADSLANNSSSDTDDKDGSNMGLENMDYKCFSNKFMASLDGESNSTGSWQTLQQ